MNKLFKYKEYSIAVILSLVHCIITFYTDKHVFTALSDGLLALPSDKLFNYILCKILLLFALFFIYRTVFRIIFTKDKKELKEYQIFKHALPYLIVLIAVLIFKLPQGFLSNDENLIFAESSNLNSYTWFYYLTTYYYNVCLMLIPAWFGPVIIKVLIQFLICGYTVYRMNTYLNGNKVSYIMYLPFILPPVLAYTTSAHRIPIYYLLYLLILYILFMDMLENVQLTKSKGLLLLLLSAVLTQWRTEGIYLAVIIPILMFVCYKNIRNKRIAIKVILASILIQYIVAIPQYGGLVPDRLGDQANNRMGPFWAYTITNMYRNGLDLEKNKDDLEKVGRYLDLDVLKAINDDLGDINYEDTLILYFEGYTGLIENATVEDYIAYTEGCKNIFINNPDVLIRTKLGSFDYAARPYHLKSGIVNKMKDIVYDVYLPLLIILILWVYSVIRKNPYFFFATSGIIGHFIIVFVLSPASYFKYYFPIYMMGYFYLILIICMLISKTNKKAN